MTEDPIHRASRWAAFYDEPGGLGEVIQGMRREYFERHASLGLSDQDKRYALSLADKALAEIDRHIRAIVETGKIEAHRDHVKRIEKLPAAQRRWI